VRRFFRLIKAWISGRYRVVPWQTITLLAVTSLYALSPLDLIPDYIPFIGVVDDLTLFGFLLRSFVADVRTFAELERRIGKLG